MSPSSDIETLFDHFGGKASGYQEIGRENEAGSARTRWPLLVTLDLKQPSIPAIVPRRTPEAAPPQAAVPAVEPGAAASDEPGSAAATTPPKPLKGSIFTRAHRHSIPPVAAGPTADTPRGGERFAPPPVVDAAAQSAASALREPPPPAADTADVAGIRPSLTAPAAAGSASVHPDAGAEWNPTAFARLRAAPAPDASRAGASPSSVPTLPAAPLHVAVAPAPAFGAAPPLSARATAASSTHAAEAPDDPVSRPQVFGAPASGASAFGQPPSGAPGFGAPPSGASAFGQPPSGAPGFGAQAFGTPASGQPASIAPAAAPILGRLFAGAPAAAPVANAPPATLASLFERLRRGGAPQTAQAAAPHSWLTNGPRRS